MADEENADAPSKRYNTRPKTKSSFEALENKYALYVVNTSPKAAKRPRNQGGISYTKYQKYLSSQGANSKMMGAHGHHPPMVQTMQGYQMAAGHPGGYGFQPGMMDPRFAGHVQGAPQDMAQFQTMMRPNPYNAMVPNQPQYLQNFVPGTAGNMGAFNQMAYTQMPNRFNVPDRMYNDPTRFPMPQHSNQSVPYHPGYQPMQAPQHAFGDPSRMVKRPYPKAQQFMHPQQRKDGTTMMANMERRNIAFSQQVPPVDQRMAHYPDPSAKIQPAAQTAPQVPQTQIQGYFNAVDVILKDISETSKFEKKPEGHLGCVSVLDSYEFSDPHKMVSFEYLINGPLYSDVVEYFGNFEDQFVELPLPAPAQGSRKGSSKANSPSSQADTTSPTLGDSAETSSTEVKSQAPLDNTTGMKLAFNSNKIQLNREKKMFPITDESCKQLSHEELGAFLDTLTKTNCVVVRRNRLKKNRLKSVILTVDETTNHYLISLSQASGRLSYFLKYQFGYFFANDFFNKRVPLFTNVDFGDVNPSFLFTRNKQQRKHARNSLASVRTSRSYDLYLGKLDLWMRLEVSKVLRESDLQQTVHHLALHCRLEALPKLLGVIHFK